MSEKSKKTSIYGKLAYILSALLILGGLSSLGSGTILTGLIFILTGILCTPFFWNYIQTKYDYAAPTFVKVIAVIALLFIAGMFSTTGTTEQTNVVADETEILDTSEIDIEISENPDREEYALKMAQLSTIHSEALTKMSTILAEDPAKVFLDEDTKLELVITMAIIKSSYQTANEVIPPAEFDGIHQTILTGLEKHSESMDKLADGIDKIDVSLIEEAVALMEEGTTYINQATAKLLELQ